MLFHFDSKKGARNPKLTPYLADSKVQPHVNDDKHEKQVERTNNK